LDSEFLDEKEHIGLKVIKAVIKYRLDLLFRSRIGEISFYTLKDNFVDIYKIEEGCSVRKVLEQYRNNQLEQVTTPTHSIEDSLVEK